MARGELFRAVPGAAFRRLRWAGLDHAKVVKPAYPVYNTEADEGVLRPPFDPPANCFRRSFWTRDRSTPA